MALIQASIKSNMVLRWGGVEFCSHRLHNIKVANRDSVDALNCRHRLLCRCRKGLLDGGDSLLCFPDRAGLLCVIFQRLQRQLQCFFVSHGRFLSVNKHRCNSQHDSHIIGLAGFEHGCSLQLRLIRGGCSHGNNAVFVEGLIGSHWCLSVWYGSIIPGSR